MNADSILPAIHVRLAAALAFDPRGLRPLLVAGTSIGLLDAPRAEHLRRFPKVFTVAGTHVAIVNALQNPAARSAAMDTVARALAADGLLTRWRDERYAIAADSRSAPLFLLERAAARYFGVHTYAVHVNGFAADGCLWVARRSVRKAIDPGQLDNLVGGGVAHDQSAGQTLIKESWEEAGIDAATAARAAPTPTLHTRRLGGDGVQRETIFAYDLALPRDFVPANQDGEAGGHRLLGLVDAAALLAHASGPDHMTVDASLVTFDALLRRRIFSADDPHALAIAALSQRGGAGSASDARGACGSEPLPGAARRW